MAQPPRKPATPTLRRLSPVEVAAAIRRMRDASNSHLDGHDRWAAETYG